ncbi:hypothetical protein ONE63_011434 [Megalurothrips usitatus]|uniref:BTB domain-containing protein n=1 Tax=Megalurothrips usitatus TaxID=439358 RepID=A0AAV7X5K1_9NEOP|nr:hypothetical protein ONE63_011434 [Megalurothrips usitatus]
MQTEGIRAPLEDAGTARLHADGTLLAFVCGYTAAFRGRVSVHAHAAVLTVPAPHFATLRDQRSLCDVTFRVDDREFTAHRVVLAAASSVFRSMFDGSAAAADAPIRDTATAASFEMFLVYLYTGAVADCVCVNTMVDLLELADRYDVDALKHICVERLLHVDLKNAVVVLRAANERPVVPEEVLVVATQTIIANMQAVMGMPEWADFATVHPVAARCLKATWTAFNLQHRNTNNNIIILD